MIRLMKITEIERVMDIWSSYLIDTIGVEKGQVAEYEPAAFEMMQHANVYVYVEDNLVTGFISIVGGYYVSNLIFSETEEVKEALQFVQERYDELQVDLFEQANANEVLLSQGFKFLGKGIHDVLGYDEKEYEWLK